MLNFWIDDVGASLNGICIRFLEVCLSYRGCLFFYWLGLCFRLLNFLNFRCFSWSLVASTFVFNTLSMFRNSWFSAKCTSVKWLKQINILTSIDFPSAQSSFISKFLLDFWDKFWRLHTALPRPKILEAQKVLKKQIFHFIEKRFQISISYIFLKYFCLLFPSFIYIYIYIMYYII